MRVQRDHHIRYQQEFNPKHLQDMFAIPFAMILCSFKSFYSQILLILSSLPPQCDKVVKCICKQVFSSQIYQFLNCFLNNSKHVSISFSQINYRPLTITNGHQSHLILFLVKQDICIRLLSLTINRKIENLSLQYSKQVTCDVLASLIDSINCL